MLGALGWKMANTNLQTHFIEGKFLKSCVASVSYYSDIHDSLHNKSTYV